MFNKIVKSLLLLVVATSSAFAQNAKWIGVDSKDANNPNTWTAFRKDVSLASVPKSLVARISVDSKYWLWINGELVVFEGGLKRGPTPTDTYCDEVDIAKYLKQGENKIALLHCYFGKSGFSHLSSGKSGLFFEAKGEGVKILSDSSWKSVIHPAYSSAITPPPNMRLSEGNIKFDANKDIPNWQVADAKLFGAKSVEFGEEGCAPWNKLVKRPMPQWKLYDIKEAQMKRTKGAVYNSMMGRNAPAGYDTITARVPYNMQMTPIITVEDPIGNSLIDIQTDHTFGGTAINIRAEYITKKGEQTYESFGWMNGQNIILYVPKHVNVKSVKYRESGYNTEMSGTFDCDSEFYMMYWKKAVRTLYVNMRDNFFDCPDRERAQWWGDAVQLISEAFYTMDPKSHGIMKKAIRELISWQLPNGVLHSPIPGLHKSELPGQMCASVSYGFWNYYMNTGDIETIKFAYPSVKKYLGTWSFDADGLPYVARKGWHWGDWGQQHDKRLIFAAWYSIALQRTADMADVLGYSEDAKQYRATAEKIKESYNKFWNGKAYRHSTHKGWTDDRVQVLAVLANIADESKYDAIFRTLLRYNNSSTYMEKYVMEALIKMGKYDYALNRTQLRFDNMTVDKKYSTLWESWQVGGDGGGTVNHAWSGGALTNIAQFYCGLYPLEAGWKTYRIAPNPSLFERASISVPTVAGDVKSAFEIKDGKYTMKISVPQGATAILYMPELVNAKTIKINGSSRLGKFKDFEKFKCNKKPSFKLEAGDYVVEADCKNSSKPSRPVLPKRIGEKN